MPLCNYFNSEQKIEGFRNLLEDQNLKDIIKDRTLSSLLDDLNVRETMSENNSPTSDVASDRN